MLKVNLYKQIILHNTTLHFVATNKDQASGS